MDQISEHQRDLTNSASMIIPKQDSINSCRLDKAIHLVVYVNLKHFDMEEI